MELKEGRLKQLVFVSVSTRVRLNQTCRGKGDYDTVHASSLKILTMNSKGFTIVEEGVQRFRDVE